MAVALIVPALVVGVSVVALILVEGVVVAAVVVAAIVLVKGADGRAVVGADGVSRVVSVSRVDATDGVSVPADGASTGASTASMLWQTCHGRAVETECGESDGESD